MVQPSAIPGEVVSLPTQVLSGGADQIRQLVKTGFLRISHIAIPAGRQIPTYEAEGEVVLHCLEGKVSVTALARSSELASGQLLFLVVNEPFSIVGLESSSLLITVIQPPVNVDRQLIGGE